jgi:hypothetical protein
MQRKLDPPVDAHRCERYRYAKTLLVLSVGALEAGNPKKRSSETEGISESVDQVIER